MVIECREPPCIHVVKDDRKKVLAVFYEDSEGSIVWIPIDRLSKACKELNELLSKGYREASGTEIDKMAAKYLGAEPEQEYGEWEEE